MSITALHRSCLPAIACTLLFGLGPPSACRSEPVLLVSEPDSEQSQAILDRLQIGLDQGQLAQLKQLDLSGAPLLNSELGLLLNMPGLESLTLDHIVLQHGDLAWILRHLPNLKHLSLQDCALDERVFDEFPPGLQLAELNLAFNQIRSLPADFNALVPQLGQLDLSANPIPDFTNLSGALYLKRLKADQLRGSELQLPDRLPALRELDLIESVPTAAPLQVLANYPHLEHLALGQLRWNAEIEHLIAHKLRLKSLQLEEIETESPFLLAALLRRPLLQRLELLHLAPDALPSAAANAPCFLQRLALQEMELSKPAIQWVQSCSQLKSLDMSGSQINASLLDGAAFQLQQLVLAETRLPRAGLSGLHRQTGLRDLDIRSLTIMPDVFATILKLNKLQRLAVDYQPWSDQKMQQLLQALPELRFLSAIGSPVSARQWRLVQARFPHLRIQTEQPGGPDI
ncbi:MAG: hypothetical protein KDK39_15795 [Leptospiraceae bacterium]|nr:hypothetical protein [Leptospiraceae bacterium]